MRLPSNHLFNNVWTFLFGSHKKLKIFCPWQRNNKILLKPIWSIMDHFRRTDSVASRPFQNQFKQPQVTGTHTQRPELFCVRDTAVCTRRAAPHGGRQTTSLTAGLCQDISRFPPRIDCIFQGKHSIHFLMLKLKDFRNFVLHNWILVFEAEQVHLMLQVTNLKNKEVTVNPNPKP